MKPPRTTQPSAGGRRPQRPDPERDFEALRQTSAVGLPKITDTARILREAAARESREGLVMKLIRSIGNRPWLTTAACSALVAVLLLTVPISYTRTTGYDVQLKFPSNELKESQVRAIAERLQEIVQAESISLSHDEKTQDFHLFTQIDSRGVPNVDAVIDAFTGTLIERGISAEASVVPIIERFTNNMLAYASDKVREIRIDRQGKSLAEIEEEIRMRLEEVGFLNPSVTVTDADGETRIDIEGELPDETEGSTEMRIQVQSSSSGLQESMSIRAKARHGMTDEELREELTRQLKEQGVDADVIVKDGEVVSVKRR
jgi:hypothetical protein